MEQRSQGPRILGPIDGKTVDFGSFGVRFMVWSEESGGGFSLVEFPIPPRTLVAPLHRHANEDEYSYVLEGRMGRSSAMRLCTRKRGSRLQTPRPVAYFLERRRRAVQDPRDHVPWRVRACVRGNG